MPTDLRVSEKQAQVWDLVHRVLPCSSTGLSNIRTMGWILSMEPYDLAQGLLD